ncbi:MAG: DUF6088 family protein [Bacteroidales bacterium]|nr:DUF6088 family protein [Bacteroidales bacterium]
MSDLKNVNHTRGIGTLTSCITQEVASHSPNSIFFNSDFADKGDADVIRHILGKLCQQGILVRIAPGIFVNPQISKFGMVPVTLEAIAYAVAKRDHVEILPTGETALNILGLSTQVPMRAAYLTTGSPRSLKIGNRSIKFIRGVPRNFACNGHLMPLIIQALKSMGRDNVTEATISQISKIISESVDPHLLEDMLLAPQWIQKLIKPMLKQ